MDSRVGTQSSQRPAIAVLVTACMIVGTWALAVFYYRQDFDLVATQFGAGRPERWREPEHLFLVPVIFTILVLAMAWLARMLAHGRIGSSLSARDRNAAVQNLRGVQVFVAALGGVMVWLQGHTAAGNSGLVGSVIAYVLVGVMIAWLVIMTVRRARE